VLCFFLASNKLLFLQSIGAQNKSEMPSPNNNNNNNNVTNIVGNIGKSAHEFASNTPVSRNSLIEIAQELIANLELPSESIQRIGWAEVSWRLCFNSNFECWNVGSGCPY
jgi:hypothetical protein